MINDVASFGLGGMRSVGLGIPEYGSKAARLASMAMCGMRVPPSIALPISECRRALADNGDISVSFEVDISRGVRSLQRTTRKWLGDKDSPLILVVRLSPVKAQGGLDVPVIIIGWTEDIIKNMENTEDRERAYRDLAFALRELSVLVYDVPEHFFDEKLEEAETEDPISWSNLYSEFKEIAYQETKGDIPFSPLEQLILAVKAVWRSWYQPRAQSYRQLYDIDDAGGIGVLIQVYVPFDGVSEVATGWLSVRSEETGESKIIGELREAGASQPKKISSLMRNPVIVDLVDQARLWEAKSARAERLDFIVTEEAAYILDGTPLSLSTKAELTFCVEMAKTGAITKQEAVLAVDPARLIDVLHSRLAPNQDQVQISKGLSASPGAASGCVVFSARAAEALTLKGVDVVLVCSETSPEDIRGMQSSNAIVTAKGGLTSHAAVIARGTGKPCIVSVSGIKFHTGQERKVEIEGRTYVEGDELTVDGSSGILYEGRLKLRPSEVSGDLSTLLSWADEFRRMKVLTNVETSADAALARNFGAEGIGLCRTEHMLFEPDRLDAMRRIILGTSQKVRDDAVLRLSPLLRDDFVKLFEIMREQPVTIRLFDPPLHEFLPKEKSEIKKLARELGYDANDLAFQIDELGETNPMLGNRGCRLLICNPELAKDLVEIVFEAAIEVSRRHDIDIRPEIMIPLVAMSREFIAISRLIDDAAQVVDQRLGYSVHYKVGSMIELPRAAIIAERIALEADFFSFGTNDLTQTTFGISRDDAVAFLTTYERMGLMESDPFISIDVEGVGAVIELATKRGREANPDLQVGICGEHGGDPASIHFCEKLKLDYVSCSPFRVPIARLAAAQATLSLQS